MKKSDSNTYFVVYGALIAALYTALTAALAPISFGAVQFRVSEALCVLPYFTPAAVPGVFAGCLLSNLLCGAAAPDVIFGSLATLIGAIGSYGLRRNRFLVCLPPILSNTIIIPWVLRFAYGSEDLILFSMITVGIGEILAVGVLGSFLLAALEGKKNVIFGKCLAGKN